MKLAIFVEQTKIYNSEEHHAFIFNLLSIVFCGISGIPEENLERLRETRMNLCGQLKLQVLLQSQRNSQFLKQKQEFS